MAAQFDAFARKLGIRVAYKRRAVCVTATKLSGAQKR
jgi:hypothetical protein